jgi:glutathione S-transferase
MPKPIIYHIPVCPFSQRVEILLSLKGLTDAVEFRVMDITVPRPDWFLEMTGGTTSMPVMDLGDGRVLKESLVILRYVEEAFGTGEISRVDPYERAVERMLVAREGAFTVDGYTMVMNRDRAKTDSHWGKMMDHYAWFDAFLRKHNPDGTWLFDDFGFAECVFTPLFMRFWFLEYYEGFSLPDDEAFARVRKWYDACLGHTAAQQVTKREIVTVYYDYAVGLGNGALPEGRKASSFAFEPAWDTRPLPPKDKYDRIADDMELGLLSH